MTTSMDVVRLRNGCSLNGNRLQSCQLNGCNSMPANVAGPYPDNADVHPASVLLLSVGCIPTGVEKFDTLCVWYRKMQVTALGLSVPDWLELRLDQRVLRVIG